MKSLKFLLISLVATLTASESYACLYEWYLAEEYYMFRAYDAKPEPELAIDKLYPGAGNNCKGWQDLTSDTIPLEDIYKVVYSMSLEEFEKMYDNRNVAYKNKFAEWITKKDTSILEFLHLAKTNEYLRLEYSSSWYYPTMKTSARMTIEEVAEKALANKDSKLRDRYLLQAVRALFSMKRYNDCVDLWDKEISKLPADNLMRQITLPYIAGAEFRTNNSKKALEYFAQIGDVESILFCTGRQGEKISSTDALSLVCKYAPNSPYVAKTLHAIVKRIEPGSIGRFHGGGYLEWREEQMKKTIDKLYPLCMEMAKNSKVENPAMWYYTAAFLSDLIKETEKAAQLLSLAEKAKSTPYIDDSIEVFRIYLDAKLSVYDSAYEKKLFKQLKWLDSKIINNIDDDVRSETAWGIALNRGISYYYWNDMLRRIVLSEVCPRMMKAGKTTRAIQLANMADNRLIQFVNKRQDYYCTTVNGKFQWGTKNYTLSEYRYDPDMHNNHDYSNNFFGLIDSVGVNEVSRYMQNLNAPKSEFDHFLNARGYTESDYLNDIIGTQCLREMRYGEATKYLAKVSKAYNSGHLNVIMQYNPFSTKKETMDKKSNTRYEFARKMYDLEQKINSSTDPNEKAKLMLRFATGMRNSFDLCWPLTQYYRGCFYWCDVYGMRVWERDKYTITAISHSKQMIASACNTATDKEVAAEIHYELCNFKTVAEKYPDTQKGKLVRGKCDKLYDYHVENIYPSR